MEYWMEPWVREGFFELAQNLLDSRRHIASMVPASSYWTPTPISQWSTVQQCLEGTILATLVTRGMWAYSRNNIGSWHCTAVSHSLCENLWKGASHYVRSKSDPHNLAIDLPSLSPHLVERGNHGLNAHTFPGEECHTEINASVLKWQIATQDVPMWVRWREFHLHCIYKWPAMGMQAVIIMHSFWEHMERGGGEGETERLKGLTYGASSSSECSFSTWCYYGAFTKLPCQEGATSWIKICNPIRSRFPGLCAPGKSFWAAGSREKRNLLQWTPWVTLMTWCRQKVLK